ncbi:hypothetical protein BpHYR1_023448 [Brachionus plicatilis]|uniref:Uncharacterized protein n=1 Tax=Brachionus plicatilis TaxID=10195 RepID=A0A3M7Q5Y6_BRAPC|nr:hypothetical protein BpHYR1_023448 [Brachionus plicatilis]
MKKKTKIKIVLTIDCIKDTLLNPSTIEKVSNVVGDSYGTILATLGRKKAEFKIGETTIQSTTKNRALNSGNL